MRTQLTTERQQRSDLLFPTAEGTLRSTTSLLRPFAEVAEACGITKTITPRSMRRTFNDLSRLAGTESLVTRAISGHATEEMREHYSTISAEERREAVAKVIDLMGYRAEREAEIVDGRRAEG